MPCFEEAPSSLTNVTLEYIWLDHHNNFRSKTKVTTLSTPILDGSRQILNVQSLPDWNYDGSSTEQASGNDSEVCLRPVAVYNDPFRSCSKTPSWLVLCSTWLPNGEPHPDNSRYHAENIFRNPNVENAKTWFGIEQEFFLIDNETNKVLGFYDNYEPESQGKYYCGVGAGTCDPRGRQILETTLKHGLHAGLGITGINLEVAPGQYEVQVRGEGIQASDDIMMLRYILTCVAEEYNIRVELDPKPLDGNWNGSGCHVNFSTLEMRTSGGLSQIYEAIEKLKNKHQEHIAVYGAGNERRLTGKHETASIHDFSSGVADRGASIRIPRETEKNGCGYLEDRRPASNMNPYVVTSKLVSTILLD